MRLLTRKLIVAPIMIGLPLLLAASCFLYPPEIRYNSYLVPTITSDDQSFTIDEETQVYSYDLGGSSIMVRYMTEEELNNMFPADSAEGQYSTNPYTYGNWIDPDLGYTPVRFTTFEISIINRTFAKMSLDPTEAVLITNIGETLHSYTTSIAAAKYGKSFEDYYKAIRGQSGNDNYRYEMRIGNVRGKNYGLDEMIFRGDSYSGMITFDKLRDDVDRVRLVLNDIVYRFDAFNRPADIATINFDFNRVIEKEEISYEQRMAELEREKVRINSDGPRQLVGNRINDSARNNRAIERVFLDNTVEMETCFIDRYRRDEVIPGSMVLSLTIEPDGTVSNQNVIEVDGINSEDFMNCVLDVVEEMKFQEIEDMPTEGTSIVKGAAKPVNVTYPLEFQVYVEGQTS